MSFGSDDMLPEIRNAIEKALRRNVIVLAAAGNSGNCRSLPYPADEDGVFKIFAANTSGYTAKFTPPTDVRNPDQSYFILGCGIVSTWPSCLQKKSEADGLNPTCYNKKAGHKHSEGGCDIRTVMSGTSFATPIAAALVAIIYQFYDANKSLESRVCLRHGSEDRFKTPKAVRAIFKKMSRTSLSAPYNFLEPARGKDDYFYFRPYNHLGLDNEPVLNFDRQTPIQFFSKKISEALYLAKI